jgi:ABC-type multidrug transport system fused ATPase/permease subunit
MTVYEKAVSRKMIILPEENEAAQNGSTTHGATNGNSNDTKANSSNDNSRMATTKKLFKVLIGSADKSETKPTSHASTGQILNLVRSDVNEIADRFEDIYRMVRTPFGSIFSIVLIWRLLGWSCLLAVAVVVGAHMINGILARLQVRWQRYRKKATDERVQMNSQFLQVVRHLRWYGWEEPWLNKVMASRRHELNVRIVSMLLTILTYIITVSSGAILPVVAFFAYTTLAKQKLRIDLIFPALQLLGNLQGWLRAIPNIITTLLNAYVAMGRIENFLKEPEKDNAKSVDDPVSVHIDSAPLQFFDCTFAWPGTSKPILNSVSLTVNTGLTVVYGKIGGGKTALLQAMLGEMDKISGQYEVPNEMIGYYSQTPWLQSVSIRDNILFFSAYDEERYGLVLEACALRPDLASFKDGDLSHIGEK